MELSNRSRKFRPSIGIILPAAECIQKGNNGVETKDGVRSRALSVLQKYFSYDSAGVVCHGMVIHSLTGREVAYLSNSYLHARFKPVPR